MQRISLDGSLSEKLEFEKLKKEFEEEFRRQLGNSEEVNKRLNLIIKVLQGMDYEYYRRVKSKADRVFSTEVVFTFALAKKYVEELTGKELDLELVTGTSGLRSSENKVYISPTWESFFKEWEGYRKILLLNALLHEIFHTYPYAGLYERNGNELYVGVAMAAFGIPVKRKYLSSYEYAFGIRVPDAEETPSYYFSTFVAWALFPNPSVAKNLVINLKFNYLNKLKIKKLFLTKTDPYFWPEKENLGDFVLRQYNTVLRQIYKEILKRTRPKEWKTMLKALDKAYKILEEGWKKFRECAKEECMEEWMEYIEKAKELLKKVVKTPKDFEEYAIRNMKVVYLG